MWEGLRSGERITWAADSDRRCQRVHWQRGCQCHIVGREVRWVTVGTGPNGYM